MVMNVRPILFSGPMVRALLDGRKTQTRRIVKPQPEYGDAMGAFRCWQFPLKGKRWIWPNAKADILAHCPYGQPGDLLWVRESIRIGEDLGADWVRGYQYGDRFTIYEGDEQYNVPDDYEPPRYTKEWLHGDEGSEDYWRSWDSVRSIHMPRWASRLTLELTDVRIERVQDISGQDCWEEGIESAGWDCEKYGSVTHCYRDLWEQINGPGSWDANPWVWVLSFTAHQVNVDELLKRAA